MKKLRFWGYMACFAMLLTLVLAASTKADAENNTTYTLDADGTLTVYCEGVCNGVPLTETEWKTVKTIVFAEGVTEIGEAAFAYLDMTEVVLPKGMTVLGYGAFYECTKLASVTLPETLLEIDGYAFCHTALTSIKLPASLNKIGGAAFAECYNLRSLTVPEGVSTLGSAVFWGCGALQELYLPASLTSIGESAFRDTDPALRVRLDVDNAHYCTLDDVLFTKDMKTLVRYPAYKTNTAYTVPDGVETIFGEAFYGAKNLVSLTLPEGLKTIGGKAFADCKNLKKIVIPESVTALGTVGAGLGVPRFAMSGNYSVGPLGDSCFAEIVVLSRTVDVTASRWGDMHIPAGVTIYCYHYSETDKGARQAKDAGANPEFTLAYLDEDHEHDYTERITVAPSCTAEGEKVLTCSICGWTETEVIAKLDHTIGEPKITPATCIYEGEKLFACTGCTYSYSERLPKVEHPYPKWDLSNISCVESAVSRKCAYCGRIQTMTLCGDLHAYGEWEQTKKPTLKAVGEEQRVCDLCGYAQVRAVPEMSFSEFITPYVYILDALLVVILLVLLWKKKS